MKGSKAILLTGGTGFLGRHLAPGLARWAAGRGYRLRALVRPPLERPAVRRLGGLGFELFVGDLRHLRESELTQAAEGAEIIVHLVGLLEGRRDELLEVNYRGTVRLLEAARAVGTRRLIHLSSLGASPNPRFPYAHSIWLAEEEVRRSGLEFVIFRPAVLVGPGEPFLGGLIRMARSRLWPCLLLPRSKAAFQPLWVEDLARCILRALDLEAERESDHLIGRTVELGGPGVFTLDELAALVLTELGVRKPIVHLPRRALRLLERLSRRLHLQAPWTATHLLGKGNLAGDEFERVCGWQPRPLEGLLPELIGISGGG